MGSLVYQRGELGPGRMRAVEKTRFGYIFEQVWPLSKKTRCSRVRPMSGLGFLANKRVDRAEFHRDRVEGGISLPPRQGIVAERRHSDWHLSRERKV